MFGSGNLAKEVHILKVKVDPLSEVVWLVGKDSIVVNYHSCEFV